MTTYWLAVAGGARRRNSLNASIGSNISGNSNTKNDPPPQSANNAGGARHLCAKHERLVNWITNELANLLKKIKIQRLAIRRENSFVDVDGIMKLEQAFATRRADEPGKIPLDEVEEIITLPKFEHEARSIKFMSQDPVQLQESVLSELHTYIHTIATMYDDNPFHNFEHASHVTMSVVKLLSRIIAPDINFAGQNVASTLHDHTFGITSDPLTQFATVLSALIHDADHPGVPNSQLIKEKTRLASFYKAKSIAEQNSVDLAWTLLMDDEFTNLRAAIYRTEAEFKRFRQLIVNTVMATDIMDKDLGAARKARWNKAFLEETKEEDTETAVNRKATIVIEHIIQASDIAHTMQHWHIYRKWNGRLFEEMYKVSFVKADVLCSSF